MTTSFLYDGPEDGRVTVLLAHGAGAPMDSAGMTAIARALAAREFRVARFEFGYMAARRGGERKPPPRAETLIGEYVAAVDDLGPTKGPLVIGGHSMGGRVASMAADALFDARRMAGLLCLSYPFHPPGRPTQPRTGHLMELATPALFVQGTRDEFGSPDEIAGYHLPKRIEIVWLEDGDHSLKPRKAVSGFTYAQHMARMGEAAANWAARLVP
jgi:predicted alpha/beta-hydrolase family hydrolase